MFNRLSLIFLLLSSADGFIIKRRTRNNDVSLFGNAYAREDFSGGDDPVEAARQRFEAMMVPAGEIGNIQSATKAEVAAGKSSSVAERPTLDVSEFPPLTSVARERLEAEIDLLSSLSDSEEGEAELFGLWESERGLAAGRLLREADAFIERHQWEDAENLLLQVIDAHGMHWIEPISRLAKLFYKQGRLEESKKLCMKVLAVKPWHTLALSGIVKVHEELHEVKEARYWAARRLPSLKPTGPNLRRQQWVLQASKEARNMLEQLEDHTRAFYGRSEHPDDRSPHRSHLFDDDEDAWQ